MSIANKVTIAVGAEAANAITVNLELQTINGRELREKAVVDMYLSSDAAGNVPVDAMNNGIVPTAGTNGALVDAPVDAANHFSWKMVSEADGLLDVVLTNAGDADITRYLNVVQANGKVRTSAAITFVDDTP